MSHKLLVGLLHLFLLLLLRQRASPHPRWLIRPRCYVIIFDLTVNLDLIETVVHVVDEGICLRLHLINSSLAVKVRAFLQSVPQAQELDLVRVIYPQLVRLDRILGVKVKFEDLRLMEVVWHIFHGSHTLHSDWALRGIFLIAEPIDSPSAFRRVKHVIHIIT